MSSFDLATLSRNRKGIVIGVSCDGNFRRYRQRPLGRCFQTRVEWRRPTFPHSGYTGEQRRQGRGLL